MLPSLYWSDADIAKANDQSVNTTRAQPSANTSTRSQAIVGVCLLEEVPIHKIETWKLNRAFLPSN